jgi:hypothetical protein
MLAAMGRETEGKEADPTLEKLIELVREAYAAKNWSITEGPKEAKVTLTFSGDDLPRVSLMMHDMMM